MNKLNTLLFITLSLFANATIVAQEHNSPVQNNIAINESMPQNKMTDEFIWQITGGISVLHNQTIIQDDIDPDKLTNMLAITLLVDVYYKGFFIQSNQRRTEGLFGGGELGYQLINKEDWSLEVLIKQYLREIDSEEIIKETNQNDSILAGLTERKIGQGLGLRYSKFIDDNILSIDIASLVSIDADNDWVAEIYYSHLIPYRNWDIYLGAGLTYYTADVVNYYVGIEQHEVTEQREFYQTGSGYKAQFEMFALRPISESWTFKVGLTHSSYSSNIGDSPIVKSKNASLFTIGAMYAF